jgi:hypothetical protein
MHPHPHPHAQARHTVTHDVVPVEQAEEVADTGAVPHKLQGLGYSYQHHDVQHHLAYSYVGLDQHHATFAATSSTPTAASTAPTRTSSSTSSGPTTPSLPSSTL